MLEAKVSFEQIISCDDNLIIKKEPLSKTLPIVLTTMEYLKDGQFCLVTEKKYLKNIQKIFSTGRIESVGMICSFQIWQDNSVEKQEQILPFLDFLLLTKEIAISLSRLTKLLYFQRNFQEDFIYSKSANIHKTAVIGKHVTLGSRVVVDEKVMIYPCTTILSDVHIKRGTVIFPGVTIYHNVIIGQNCRIHASTTIGSDGFSYRYAKKNHYKVWHFGGVEIGDNVEIGSHSTIDAGTYVPTKIGNSTKIDNSVQIAHNCKIGNQVIICGDVGIGGSAVLENKCTIGGKVAIRDHVRLVEGTQVTGGSVVVKDSLIPYSKLGGYPAKSFKDWSREIVYLKNISGKQNKR